MEMVIDRKEALEDINSSYEARVQTIGTIFDGAYQLLEDFKDTFIDKKQEREKVSAQIRDTLAQNGFLRRKDFDNMTREVLLNQDESEKQVKCLLDDYLKEQKGTVQTLRGNLERFKEALAAGENGRVKEFQSFIKDILSLQEKRKEEITFRLREYQKEQKEVAESLKELLAKGRELRIKDLKNSLKKFKSEQDKRIARSQERKVEVAKMLEDFKNERRS